jgi:hypothetical protein
MRKAEVICALAILAVGAVVGYDSIQQGAFGWGLSGPDPGMYPFLLGLGLMIGSVIVLGRTLLASFRRARAEDKPFLPPGALKPVLCVAIPASLMVLLTEYIGLYLAAGLYLAVYMRWIGRHRWISVAAVSILLPLASYIVFDKWFLIPMPAGSLAAYLRF